MTEGARGGTIETAAGIARFDSPSVAAGLSAHATAERAAHHGAAVLASLDPLDAQLPLP